MYDCLVVGGGPAGLTAAIYLARFHLKVVVLDNGKSRAATIPLSRNHSGHPDGIPGAKLLAQMREQAIKYGAELQNATVENLQKAADGFVLQTHSGHVEGRAVLIASGVANRRPDMPDDLHDRALLRGLLRYCPICDAYEVTDRRIAVLGNGTHGMQEAVFLRSYTSDVTLITPGATEELKSEEQERLRHHGIATLEGPPLSYRLLDDAIAISLPHGERTFASLYPALGSDVRSTLAKGLGAELTEDGCIAVDKHQRTSVPGLYAAGDVVAGLDQISHAMGQASVAATAMRNDLCERHPALR